MSTSGVVPGIRRLTALGPQFTLAVSLHAARNALRDVLVPLNRRWPVEEVVEAAREHARTTGRRVTYEATMIDGINDTDADADAMAELLRDEHAHVNLIPMNAVAHTPWTGTPSRAASGLPRASARQGSRPRSGSTAGPRSGRPAASSPPSTPASRRRSSSSAAASGSSQRAQGPPRRALRRPGPGRGGGGLTISGVSVPSRRRWLAPPAGRPHRGVDPRQRPRRPRR